ncbi:MAG: hypothetical protein QNJ00_07900 [Woeseiaceae bacterium]|nr:hypothetical protein [Woeseiaceae bacterium]
MLIRRISRHLAEQNWVAVGLDLLIVIVGIFLGLQVDAWNDRRLDRQLEAQTLERLRTEFIMICEEARDARRYHEEVAASVDVITASMAAGAFSPADRADVLAGLQEGLNFSTGARRSGTYVDLVSGGRIALLTDGELRANLNKYDELYEKADSLFANFWQAQRVHELAFLRHAGYASPRARAGDAILPAKVIDFNAAAALADPGFRLSAERVAEYQLYFSYWHSLMEAEAKKVLELLEVDPGNCLEDTD